MGEAKSLLDGSTTYLSGPMDFVHDRADERRNGWRARITSVLEAWGVRVFDPWYKPMVKGLGRYGIEDETTTEARHEWRFDDTEEGARTRSRISGAFWPVMHVDLRMVDLSDFVIACCPTNLYSVGTPHEIVLARQQRKPVLIVSPPVRYPAWDALEARLGQDPEAKTLLEQVRAEVVVRDNPIGTPSQWYATLVGSESFFDGFGWESYRSSFDWPENWLDQREAEPHRPVRALLPFLDELRRGRLPRRWDGTMRSYRDNDDWLLLEKRAAEADS